MLHELSIENLGVIESATLTLSRGLTVVTGETGAGKTMVLSGLNLIVGGKSNQSAVRDGAQEAFAQAVVEVTPEAPGTKQLLDAGALMNDDGTMIVSRTIGTETRSKTSVGGRAIPQALLGEVSGEWVTVHGQSDQVRLRSEAKQRETLDRYAGANHLATLEAYGQVWSQWRAKRAELEKMKAGAVQAREQIDRMREDLAEIDSVAPQAGEDEQLAAEAKVLENSAAVREGVATARAAIAGDHSSSAIAIAESAKNALTSAAQHDPNLEALAARLRELSVVASDVGSDLTRYLNDLDADPARLDAVHRRRSELSGLARRLGRDMHGVMQYAEEAREALAMHDSWDDVLAEHEADVARFRAELEVQAARVTEGRRRAGDSLSRAVDAELAQLAMADSHFGVSLEPAEVSAHGADTVSMTLSSRSGGPARPVTSAASGGELSRIMLAIEVSLAAGNVDMWHTFVFDEVDAGVGGRAAIDVGRRLAALARTSQVIVVTHLAQVAAFADHHVVVRKSTGESVTRSQVTEVTGEDRVQEIARLLSGQEDSDTALAHARELIEQSSVAR